MPEPRPKSVPLAGVPERDLLQELVRRKTLQVDRRDKATFIVERYRSPWIARLKEPT